MALDPITAGLGLVGKFVDKFIPDKDLAAKLKAQAGSQEFAGEIQLMMGQMEINKIEAANKNMFVAGWRPATGWICATALAYHFIVTPFLDIWFIMPVIDVQQLYPILMGMLGLGGMRSFEKNKQVSRES